VTRYELAAGILYGLAAWGLIALAIIVFTG